MPHRLSLARQSAALRRRYTGETDSTLMPAVNRGIETLSTDERATFRDILEHGYETRLLGETVVPLAKQQFRDALLPDTTDPFQQQLEAGIVYALGLTAPFTWPEAEVVAPMPIGRMFRPGLGTKEMALHLPASVLAPMMALLVPRLVDDRLYGLAGLRTSVYRRHVQLHLADGGTVEVASTSIRQWAAVCAFVKEIVGRDAVTDLDSRLTAAEHAVIGVGRVPGPVALGSALLRRLRILGDTFWLTIRSDGPDGVHLDWAGGTSAAQVAVALVHPLAGLPGERFFVTRLSDGSVTVIITTATGEPTAKLLLRQAPLTAPPPFVPIDASDAWSAFRRTMNKDKPMLEDLSVLAP